jgi:hypothetical protein
MDFFNSHAWYIPCQGNCYPINIWQRIQIMKLRIMYFPIGVVTSSLLGIFMIQNKIVKQPTGTMTEVWKVTYGPQRCQCL